MKYLVDLYDNVAVTGYYWLAVLYYITQMSGLVLEGIRESQTVSVSMCPLHSSHSSSSLDCVVVTEGLCFARRLLVLAPHILHIPG